MNINGIDISQFKARQKRVSIGHCEIKNESEWVSGAVLPLFDKNHQGMKTVTVDILVEGKNRQDIILNRSKLLASLREPAEIKFDGFDHLFKVIMTDHKEDETAMRRWHIVTVTLSGFEHSETVTGTGKGTITINNPGNIDSPVSVQITASKESQQMTVEGTAGEPVIYISGVRAYEKILLDGITGEMRRDDVLTCSGITLWELPYLTPGAATIACSDADADIKVSVIPIYM